MESLYKEWGKIRMESFFTPTPVRGRADSGAGSRQRRRNSAPATPRMKFADGFASFSPESLDVSQLLLSCCVLRPTNPLRACCTWVALAIDKRLCAAACASECPTNARGVVHYPPRMRPASLAASPKQQPFCGRVAQVRNPRKRHGPKITNGLAALFYRAMVRKLP